MKRKLIALALALGLAAGVGTVAAVVTEVAPVTQAEEAHAAIPDINYTADCPGNARYQQLVIRNGTHQPGMVVYRSTITQPMAWVANVVFSSSGTTIPITYVPVQWHDTVNYSIRYAANYNFWYHVDCFY